MWLLLVGRIGKEREEGGLIFIYIFFERSWAERREGEKKEAKEGKGGK